MTVDEALRLALAAHQRGRLAEAESLYRQTLAVRPGHPDATHLLGVCLLQRGDAAAATGLIEAALDANPDNASAWNNLGAAYRSLGRFDAALASFERAILLSPDYADAHCNRGGALLELHRPEEAAASLDRAIALRPEHADAHYSRGLALAAAGHDLDALASYDQAIALRPDHADAHDNKGIALRKLARPLDALACHDRAVALTPESANGHVNRASALLDLRRFEEALASCQRALALDSGLAAAQVNQGNALRGLRRFDEALASYDRAIALRPDFAEAHNNRGGVLRDVGRAEEALASFDRALAGAPGLVEVHLNRAMALEALRRLDEAAAAYAGAVALDPGSLQALGRGLYVRRCLCSWAGDADAAARLQDAIEAGGGGINPFFLLGLPTSPAQQLRCARRYVLDKCATIPAPIWQGERYAHERIRLGYFSSDFRNHPVAHLLAGVIEQHDRGRFEVTAFSFGAATDDPMRRRLEAAFDRFLDVRDRSDREIAVLAREMEIDIAIDLNGLTQDARTGIFALRPAPVQAHYLGYPGSMGADYIDYLIADRTVVPEDRQAFYSEHMAYLPHSFQANDATKAISERIFSRAELGLPETGFVFCCFNNNHKIGPEVFDIWMRLLHRIEGSVLWLLEGHPSAARNLREEAGRRGISPDRLVFGGRLELADYLARYRMADLFLDTFHFNAGTTASDALWAGLPVLTRAGETFAGRMAASLLHAIGLPELITDSPEAYEALALDLATDPARLGAIRRKLAEQRGSRPLFDTALFTRHLELAYTRMWERAQAGLPAAAIAV